MTDGIGVQDATILMHPHPTGERRFICFCGAAHAWGEKGTRTFRIPDERYNGLGWLMIRCPCGTWHMKAIPGQEAENIIKENA